MKGEPGKAPAFQFYVKDWLSDPQLRLTSASTRGIWIDLLCFMWSSNKKGVLDLDKEKICRLTGAAMGEVDKFLDEAKGIEFCDISVTNNGLLRICNRRMKREEKYRENNRLRQAKYRALRDSNTNVNEQKGGTPTPSTSPTPIPIANKKGKNPPYIPPRGSELSGDGFQWIDIKSWDAYLDHRSAIKKPLTKNAVNIALKLLKRNARSQQEIVENTILNNWTGLFELKNKKPDMNRQEKMHLHNAMVSQEWLENGK